MLISITGTVLRLMIMMFLIHTVAMGLVAVFPAGKQLDAYRIAGSGAAFASAVFANPEGGSNDLSAYSVEDCGKLYNIEDDNQICGFLSVPENYQQPAGRRIQVPFLVILPAILSDTTVPLFIAGGGGPGSAILEPAAYGLQDHFWTYNAMSIDDGRALVVVENRGVGLSRPALRCSEYAAINTGLWQQKDWSIRSLQMLDADTRCAKRLRGQGIDLSQYNAVTAARDLEQLRILLNASSDISAEQVNIYGISYGTRVAMQYESLYPQHTRSMILDSIVSPFAVPLYSDLKFTQQAFDQLFELCRRDRHCAGRYGMDLEARFYALLKELDTSEKMITVVEPVTLKPVSIPLTAQAVVSAMHGALYSHDDIARLPSVIFRMASGIDHAIADLIRGAMVGWSADSSMYDAANTSYACYDDNYAQLPRVDTSRYRLSQYWGISDSIDYMIGVCKAYGIAAEGGPPSRNVQISSPLLLLSGQLDPVTPALNADIIANVAESSWSLSWKNIAHDVISHSGCARLLASWFIYEFQNDPLQQIGDCAYPETGLYFLLL